MAGGEAGTDPGFDALDDLRARRGSVVDDVLDVSDLLRLLRDGVGAARPLQLDAEGARRRLPDDFEVKRVRRGPVLPTACILLPSDGLGHVREQDGVPMSPLDPQMDNGVGGAHELLDDFGHVHVANIFAVDLENQISRNQRICERRIFSACRQRLRSECCSPLAYAAPFMLNA